MEKNNSSWEEVSSWYDVLVGEKGHYYHREVILPNLLRLLNIKGKKSLLDLACGQGVLARNLSKEVEYWGVDIAPSLIESAQQYKHPNCHFLVGDITQKLAVKENFFDIACCILALQGIKEGKQVLQNAALHLKPKGKLFLVLNHPAFRIPRQSMWGIDEKQKLQYRRLNLYLSEQQIPIKINPQKEEEVWSFHHPMSIYSKWLLEAGFVIELMEEWVSNKKSTGSSARMENRARAEFPLFLTIIARKDG